MKKTLFPILCALCFIGCKTPTNITYFQDAELKETVVTEIPPRPVTILPGDKLMIVVHSRDAQLAALFNLPIQGYRIGSETQNTNSQGTVVYTVDAEGYIDFPIMGKIKIQGMTRDEVALHIKNRLVNENLCKDAVVTIEMNNAYINVLGEVSKPGRYALTKDRVTVLDALGMAGDLSIQGCRENVLLLRHEGNTTRSYKLNLLNMEEVASSPAYYLQQDDVIYVEPNDYRKRQTTVNGNNVLSTSFWISATSLLVTVVTLIINLSK